MSDRDERPRIGLAMIVRDEEDVIGRCLESLAGLIDCWTICDTGSSDKTPALVEELLAGLPGALHRSRWQDFGHNRTELMRVARGSADYLLLLDADHTIELRGELPSLGADCYLLEHSGDPAYFVPRLVRGDIEWHFVGATHEYLAGPDGMRQEVLRQLVVHHHGDGSSRATKFERDERMLRHEFEREPDNPRTVFYLAQTLRDLGRDAEAIALYRRRAAMGGWDEEAFYAAWQLAALVARTDAEEGRRLLEEAHAMRPSRAEPLLDLARLARFRRDYEEARRLARQGLDLPEPSDMLFVHHDARRWGLWFELAIAAYWTSRIEEALAACDHLTAEVTLPAEVASRVATIRRYCIDALPSGLARRSAEGWGERIEALCPGTRFAQVVLDVEPEWPLFNPSITAVGDGFALLVRSANYALEGSRYRFLDDREGQIRTLNYLVRLDRSLELRSVEPLVDHGAGPPRVASAPVVGYEDCRLFDWGGGMFASATVRDRRPDAVCEMALLELDGAEVASVTMLPGPQPGRHEKNWMPFVAAGELRFVYTCNPPRVLAWDRDRQSLATIHEGTRVEGMGDLRGGSQGIEVADGLSFVVHEVFWYGGARVYAQRLVLIDDAGALTGLSPRFRFTTDPIELCAGIARHGNDLILSFGAGDRLAALAVVPEGEALGLLDEPRGAGIPVTPT